MQNPKVTEDRAFNGFGTNFEGSPEPIYGQLFLPRKFKVAVTGARGERRILGVTWVCVVGACEWWGAWERCRRGCPSGTAVCALCCVQLGAPLPMLHPPAALHQQTIS